ncbi:MAG: hypothetical protein H0T79_15425 [Deltaproteobacteria bacterium]|nr:hypothetical protein [Deltaproteobacteria bacterium]
MPTTPSPSAALRELLETKLDTLEKLELVLAVRMAPDQTSSADLLARELQIGPGVLQRLAAVVATDGLVGLAGTQISLVATPDELVLLAEAAQLYADHRHLVMRLLSTIAMEQIRRMAARTFSDAFQFRKKKSDPDG